MQLQEKERRLLCLVKMKKNIFAIMFCMVFLVGTVSAFEFDNSLEYDKEDLRVTIKNNNFLELGDLLGYSEVLGTAELKSHNTATEIKHVIQGKDRAVMYYDFNFSEVYINGLGKVVFTDSRTGEIIDKEYYFAEAIYKDFIISHTKESCNNVGSLPNGTIIQECNGDQIVVGNHTENRLVSWERLSNNNIPVGNVRIALITDVDTGDYIDGVWTIAGKKVSRHAEWTESLNVNIISWWKSDDNTTTGSVWSNDSLQRNNVSISGTITTGVNCLLNECYLFGGGNLVGEANDDEFNFGSGDFTINMWFNTTAVGGSFGNNLIDYGDGTGAGSLWKIYEQGNTKIMAGAYVDSNGNFVKAIQSTNDGLKKMVTFIRDGSTLRLYINGTQDNTTSVSGSLNDDATAVFKIGTDSFSPFAGYIDDVGIWNRSLSAGEVSDLYNGGTGIIFTNVFVQPPVVTITNPVNLSTITISNVIEFAGVATDNINLVNVSLHFNGAINQTNSTPINNSQTNFTLTLSEGTHDWFYGAFDNDSQGTNSTGFRFTINTEPTLVVTSPIVNNTNFTTSTIFFNATNSTPIGTWIVNYNGTNHTLSDINTSLEVEDGSFRLLLYANNSVTGRFGLNDSIYFLVDTTSPFFNITLPLNITRVDNYSNNSVITVQYNYSASDASLDTCRFLNVSSGLNETITCGTNVTFTNLAYRQYTFCGSANDTFGRETGECVTANFDFNVLENNVFFNTPTLEGATEEFILDFNVSNGFIASAVNLNYNRTIFSTFISGITGRINASVSLVVPEVSIATNMSFNWSVSSSSSGTFNSSTFIQLVNFISIDACSTFTNVLYNFTLVDEELQTLLVPAVATLNTTIELNVELFDASRENLFFNFSNKSININPIAICINVALAASTNYSSDVIVKYEATDYAIENYNIVNSTISNATIPFIITLFDLISVDSTDFQITFSDENFVPVENALVFIDRQYISESNTFKTVELPKTDSNGQTIGHFVRNDVVYNIRIVKDAEILGNFQNIIAFCQDFTIGDCQIVLDARGSTGQIFDFDSAVGIIVASPPTFNNDTSTISFGFVTVDGNPQTVIMNITRNDVFGNRTICNNQLTAASGTLICAIDPNLDETILITTIRIGDKIVVSDTIKLESSAFGNTGYVAWFLFTLILILMIGEHKTGVFLALLASYIGAVALGFTEGSIVGVGAAGIWVIVITFIGLYKLNKENLQ